MAEKSKVPVVKQADPSVVAYVNADAAIPAGYQSATSREITVPQSARTVLGWLTYEQLVAIAAESFVLNPRQYSKSALIDQLLAAKGMVAYDAGSALAPTCGRATLDSGTATIFTAAIRADSIVLVTAMEGHTGNLFASITSPGIKFDISSTDIGDGCAVSWLIINP